MGLSGAFLTLFVRAALRGFGPVDVYKRQLEDGKVAQMGIFIPGRLGMDEGENVLSMVITGDYSGFMLFFFASGKCCLLYTSRCV